MHLEIEKIWPRFLTFSLDQFYRADSQDDLQADS